MDLHCACIIVLSMHYLQTSQVRERQNEVQVWRYGNIRFTISYCRTFSFLTISSVQRGGARPLRSSMSVAPMSATAISSGGNSRGGHFERAVGMGGCKIHRLNHTANQPESRSFVLGPNGVQQPFPELAEQVKATSNRLERITPCQ